MAFTSFTVRNTISDAGSALRRTKVAQDSSNPNGTGDVVSDSGLRADGFFLPVPEAFLESTFEANVYRRDTVELNWTFGFTLVTSPTLTEPVEVLIRASSTGEPITAGDGDKVISITASDYKLSHPDKNTQYVQEGKWVYYSMFVRYEDPAGDGFYERVATLSVQIPRNFNSTEDLWSRVPLYYRNLDAEYSLSADKYEHDQGPLYRYVELFGWELDKIRTTIYDTMRINDPEVVHSSAINALANQSGIEFKKEALGTSKLRAVLNNIGYLRRTKGTQVSIESYISALSGCGVSAVTNFNETNWATTNVFSSDKVSGIAYGNGKWVAVGNFGKTSTSTDGTTWSTVTTVGNTRHLEDVTYGNGLWMAVGVSASNSVSPCIYKSTDGVTWTAVFNGPSTGYYKLFDVTYAEGMWVAVGKTHTSVLLCTSPDGTNWTVKSTGITGAYQLNEVAYGNNKWIATSTSQQLVVSTDNGSTWTAGSTGTVVAGPNDSIYYSNNVWVVSVSNYIYRSLDNGVTWTEATTIPNGDTITSFSKINDMWIAVDLTGSVYTSTDNADNWYEVYLGDPINDIDVGGKRIVVARDNNVGTNYLIVDFNVHPMRANLFTDPFFVQGLNAPVSPDTGSIRREWTNLTSGSRKYGWGVYAKFSATPPSAMTLSTTGDGLTVTLPAMSGTVELHIYSRGEFAYNNNLTYYYSAVSSHDFKPRFIASTFLPAMESSSPPSSVTYFDDWNNSVTTFPSFKDFLTNDARKIISSIPKTTSVVSTNVIPVYKFNITLSSGSATTVTFEKPLVEYKNSNGSFFSGDEPLGGFIQDPTDALGAGLYDYHWGSSAGGSSGTDFSYYTMDEHRVQKVVDNIIENYIVPVTIVKDMDYSINWNVLE